MQLVYKSVFSIESALFIKYLKDWIVKNIVKIEKYDILLTVKGILFHDKKRRNYAFLKTKCTIPTLIFYKIVGNLFVKIDIYNCWL